MKARTASWSKRPNSTCVPLRREQHARLRLRLRGRVINDDSHDAQAHQSRFDGHGQCSRYAHLQQGSVRVKVGDHVRRGDVVARAHGTVDTGEIVESD